MIKQINLITLFLCAGQEGPFYLINPSALLYIYYLLFTIYCIYSQLDGVGLCPLPGVHTLLSEHLAVSVAPQVLQRNPSCHYHHHSLWSSSSSLYYPTYHGAAAVCRCDTQLLEFIAAAQIQSWSGVIIIQHTSSASSWATFASVGKYKRRDAKMIVTSNCRYFHLKLELWSSGEGQARIGKGWPSRWKASKLKPEPRAYTKVGCHPPTTTTHRKSH